MDPYLSLVSAGLGTQKLLLATGVSLVLERSLLAQAKQIATLDVLTQGRFVCGVGVGWSAGELANASPVPWRRRYDALAEYIQALRVIWSDGEPAFKGEFFSFDRIWSYPKPFRPAGPPVMIGGRSLRAQRLAAALGDGWCPLMPAATDVEATMRAFHGVCEEFGRDPHAVPVTFVAARDDPSALDAARAAGAHRVVLAIPPAQWAPAPIMAYLDRCAHYVAELT
jgi:alkanesulfonate monooxygenase SsuD/methylene tetrahydromethanopterin reductase-like flavin-dependent oxidoreductase (luciferase family)